MRMIILAASFMMLISCPVMIIMLIKEKKRSFIPYMILFGVTFFVALFMIIKMLVI